jgi:hypothetical protein
MQTAGSANLGGGLLYSLAADILSCNTENRVFSVDELAGLDIFVIKTLFAAYKDFIVGINKDPN